MKSICSPFFCAAALAVALPVLGMCDAVEINGTCYSGDCSTPDSISYGGSSSGSTDNTISVGGADFDVSTSFLASFDDLGTSMTADPFVTYVGASPLSSDETVTINMFQDFYYPGTGVTWDGTYYESFPFGMSSTGSASGELFINGQGVGPIGPYSGPGAFYGSGSANLTGLDGNTLGYDFEFTFTFDAGAAPGSTISSVPEPVQTIPLAMSMLGFAVFALWRRKHS